MDLFFVPQATLENIRHLLKVGITDDASLHPLVERLGQFESFDDEETMIPVDARRVEGDAIACCISTLIRVLGVAAAAEAFVQTRASFVEKQAIMPEAEVPQPMKASEWKVIMQGGSEGTSFLSDETASFLSDQTASQATPAAHHGAAGTPSCDARALAPRSPTPEPTRPPLQFPL